jgi:hypothetical protein
MAKLPFLVIESLICYHFPAATKKADVAEHPEVFDHVGLLTNEPLGSVYSKRRGALHLVIRQFVEGSRSCASRLFQRIYSMLSAVNYKRTFLFSLDLLGLAGL